jgi:hypothetical protein
MPARTIKSTMKLSEISKYLKDSFAVILSIKFMLFDKICEEWHYG